MKFLSISLHIGVRDIQKIFTDLGHQLDVWSLSNHHKIMGWERIKLDIINQHTWQDLSPERIEAFYQRYKKELSQYDGFVCFHPTSFSLLYEKFNKPIITIASTRYEFPFGTNKELWNNFNQHLCAGIDKKQIIPVANNKYDQHYCEVFTERKWKLIPSLCDYTQAKYTGKNNSHLLCSKIQNLEQFIHNPNLIVKKGGYDWKEIADFKSLVYVPYNSSVMSAFEQYTANIPLLYPSKNFLVFLWKKFGIMNELTWNTIEGRDEGSVIGFFNKMNEFGVSIPDPNNYNSEISFRYWTTYSDFYDEEWMPFIEHYDSFQDLEFLLFSLDFQQISDKIKEFNVVRKEKILNKWREVLKWDK